MRRRDTAGLTAAAALALSFAPTLMRRRRREQLAISVASTALGGLAGASSEVLVLQLARAIEARRGAHGYDSEHVARALLVGIGGLAVLAELPTNPHPGVALAGQAARVGGICALLGAVAPVRDGAAGPPAHARRRRRGRMRGAGRLAAARAPLAPAPPAAGRVPRGAPARDDGGRRCRVRGLALHRHGGGRRRDRPGRAGSDPRLRRPTRRPSVEQRARIAVDELERLGAFSRRRILVCSPTLRGYVNPIPVAAEEHLSLGDVASVVVQYHDRRTLLMPAKVSIAARTHRAVLEELSRRVLPAGPEVCVYGESLGAWASQNVFRAGGVRALDGLRVSRALWVGTRYFSRLPRLLAKGQIPSDARVAAIRTKQLLAGAGEPGWRFVFLERRTDPVVLFSGLDLIWRRPDWLPPGRWTPGVTFVGLVFDLVAATNWPASVPQALAHDYRLEGPLAVDLALGHHAGRERAAELADRLVAEEVARGARLRALRRGDGYTPGH